MLNNHRLSAIFVTTAAVALLLLASLVAGSAAQELPDFGSFGTDQVVPRVVTPSPDSPAQPPPTSRFPTPEEQKPTQIPRFTARPAPDEGVAAPAPQPANTLDWQILENPNGSQTVILLDRSRQVLAVYEIQQDSGVINLKSVRKVSWDLQLEHFNTNKPTPQDLREMER